MFWNAWFDSGIGLTGIYTYFRFYDGNVKLSWPFYVDVFECIPVPEANAGVLRMKNGQSAPMPDAICSSFSCVNPRLNISLRAFKVKAASEEPPPRPAPSGITL